MSEPIEWEFTDAELQAWLDSLVEQREVGPDCD